ncbi:hypothetical protein [Halolamina sp. C58]|uniref:hypothetical protein n=1 Tax=Halolamina sp. C58 TaxID=3421640 RepID=UPI003EC1051F
MPKLQRDGPIAVAVVGMVLATVGADLVSSPDLALWLVIGGSALTWGTLLVMGLFVDDRVWGRLMSDERMNRITHRAGAAAWLCTLATLVTLARAVDYSPVGVSTQNALLAAAAVAIAAFLGSMGYHSRRM